MRMRMPNHEAWGKANNKTEILLKTLQQLRKFDLFSQPSSSLWFSGLTQSPDKTHTDRKGQSGWQRGGIGAILLSIQDLYTSRVRQQAALLSNHSLHTTCSHRCPLEGKTKTASSHRPLPWWAPKSVKHGAEPSCCTKMYTDSILIDLICNTTSLLDCYLTTTNPSLGWNFKIVKTMSFILRMQ